MITFAKFKQNTEINPRVIVDGAAKKIKQVENGLVLQAQ